MSLLHRTAWKSRPYPLVYRARLDTEWTASQPLEAFFPLREFSRCLLGIQKFLAISILSTRRRRVLLLAP